MYILDTREIVLSFLACTSWGTRVLDAVVISLSCIVHVVVASWTYAGRRNTSTFSYTLHFETTSKIWVLSFAGFYHLFECF